MATSISEQAVNRVLDDLRRRSRNEEYYWNPVLWAEEVLGVTLWSKQKEMLMSVAQNKRTAVKSCHSSGKSFTMGILACWWVSTRGFQSLVVSTAPTYSQVHSIVWNEIRKHWGRSELAGDVTQGDVWNLTEKRSDGKERREMVAFGRRPSDYDDSAFQGLHRENGVLFLIDEAVGVPEMIFTAAEVNTTGPEDRVFAIANPDDIQTPFGRIFEKDDPTWHKITISAFDTPNFTGEIDEMPAIMKKHFPQPDWVEDMKIQWGEDSSRYKAKILAMFPDQSDFMFFTQVDIDRATDFNPADPDLLAADDERPVLGVDIARMGNDSSVIYMRSGKMVEFVSAWGKTDLIETAIIIRDTVLRLDAAEVRIDGTGIGAGVVDYLMRDEEFPHHRCMVIPMIGSQRATDPFVHANARAERHDELKTLIRDGKVKIDSDNKTLIDEMKSVRFEYNGKNAIQIESKVDMRKRGAKSPDHLDAVTYVVSDISWLLEPEPPKRILVEASQYTNTGYQNPLFDAIDW